MLLLYLITHYLLPHESNNHKPKLLHSSTIALLILGIIAFQFILFFLPRSGLKVLGYAANISPSEVIRLTNNMRTAQGLNSLVENTTLSQAALAKGADMLNNDYWAHVSPNGVEPWTFITNAGYGYRYAGENLARDFSNPSAAVYAWMASPTHRDNILSSKYKETGVAVIEGDLAGVDTTLIVQFFGTSYADAISVPPVAAAIISPQPTAAPTTQPTIGPTVAPQAQVTQIPTIIPASGETSSTISPLAGEAKVLISPFASTKGISISTVSLLLLVLVIDGIAISRKKIVRVGGRTLAHLSFLGMILAIVIIAKAGRIL